MVRFSGEFSAKHCGDSQALSLFNACDNVRMDAFSRVFSESRVITNRDKISHLDLILISLRYGYLYLRQDNRRVIQPYSPHRFSRQFGYVPDIPGSLKNDIRTSVLALIYKHWDSCTRMNTKCMVTLPIQSAITEYMVTRDYVDWWSKVYRSTPVKATKEASTSRPLHKTLKEKEDKNVTRATPPHHKNVIPREVKCSTNVPAPPNRTLLPSSDCQTHLLSTLDDDGDSLDSHIALVHPPKLKRPAIKERRRSGSSGSNNSEVHFKRLKTDTSLGPIYCDPNAEFTLNTDFLGDISTSSQPMLQRNEGAEIDDHSLWGNDDPSSDPIRVLSAAELKAYALPTKGKSNAKNDSQQIDPTGPLIKVHPPKPLNTIAFSEASLSGAAIIDASQRLRDIRQQAATAVCEQIEDMIMKHSSKTILSSKGELDKLIAELSQYGIDPSSVRGKVEGLLTSADQYNLARLSCSRKATPGTRNQRLADTESEITKVTSIRQADSDHRQSALKSLEKLKRSSENWSKQ